MGHDSLANYFKTNFALMQHHKWSISDTENMMPWERYIYIDLLQDFLKEQEKLQRDRELEQKAHIQTLNRQARSRR